MENNILEFARQRRQQYNVLSNLFDIKEACGNIYYILDRPVVVSYSIGYPGYRKGILYFIKDASKEKTNYGFVLDEDRTFHWIDMTEVTVDEQQY